MGHFSCSADISILLENNFQDILSCRKVFYKSVKKKGKICEEGEREWQIEMKRERGKKREMNSKKCDRKRYV